MSITRVEYGSGSDSGSDSGSGSGSDITSDLSDMTELFVRNVTDTMGPGASWIVVVYGSPSHVGGYLGLFDSVFSSLYVLRCHWHAMYVMLS